MNRTKILFKAAAIAATCVCLLFSEGQNAALAQTKTEKDGSVTIDGQVKLDKIVYDFGDVMLSDGPLTGTFTVTNISGKPMAIYNVVSSCGCTDVKWTRQPLNAGKSGTITATYTNDEGPYPFNKTLTVYFSNVKKPVILRLRGYSHEKKQPLAQLYPVHFGNLALKTADIKCGNLSQGSQRSDKIIVANIGGSPLKVSFANVTPGLSISVSPNPIPANSTAKMTYTITADGTKWGKNYYYATPMLAGKSYRALEGGRSVSRLGVWSFTKEDFSSLTQKQKDDGPQPQFKESTYEFGNVAAGKIVEATFSFTNVGKQAFKIYKVDADNDKAKVTAQPQSMVAPKGHGEVKLRLDTHGMPKGEVLVVVTLTTNSPLRPLVNLFIAGYIS